VSENSSCQTALSLCRRFWGDASANLHALKEYSFVVEMSAGFVGRHGGGNLVSGMPRNLCPVQCVLVVAQ
jgi:hypothetical protein